MKNWINNILIVLIGIIIFTACVEDDDPEAPSGGEAPAFGELTNDLSSNDIILAQENDSSAFVNLSWSEVNFESDVPVKYTIELAFAGEEFKTAVGIVTKEDITSYTVLVAEINAAMISLGVAPGESVAVEIRVRAWPDFLTDPSLSDPIQVTLTPYQLTFPPIYLIGDAIKGWDPQNPDTLQSFAPGVYEGIVRFSNGNFRFFEESDWGAEQWGFSTFASGSVAEEFEDTGDGDSNFKFVGAPASYKMIVNFNTLSISLEALGPPPPPASIFLISPSTVSFDLVPELEAKEAGVPVYEAVVQLEQDDKFRFFDDKSWNAEKWDWTYFGDVDSRLVESGDDQSNILFTGETGWYIMTVSIEDESITLVETSEPSQSLFIVGDGYIGAWDLTKALSLNSLGNNEFEAIGTFKPGKFRFFKEADWGADQIGYSFFADGSVDSELADAGDGDSNFSFVGDEGVYKITVSLADKTIVMEPVDAPTLHILGGGQGWDPAQAVSLTWMEGGKYEATVDLTNGEIFRFWANNNPAAWDWSGEQWGYSAFAEGSVNADFEDDGGSDSNFKFTGTDGTYTLKVDLYNQTVELE